MHNKYVSGFIFIVILLLMILLLWYVISCDIVVNYYDLKNTKNVEKPCKKQKINKDVVTIGNHNSSHNSSVTASPYNKTYTQPEIVASYLQPYYQLHKKMFSERSK